MYAHAVEFYWSKLAASGYTHAEYTHFATMYRFYMHLSR
jgi:hypothetical protein